MNNPLKRRKIILFLFTLKLLTIYYFFRSRSAEDDTETSKPSSLKRWPSLPSFRPWLPTPDVPVGSCEGYFGNGFTQQITVLEESSAGWFRCFYSATLQTSVCEVGGLRMDPEKISMSKGGEPLESVMGRKEDDELPVFHGGAFEIGVSDGSRAGRNLVNEEFLNRYLPRGSVNRHTMRALMASTRLVDANKFQCSEWVEEPTLLVTRFEYANLFHTLTDWYSAYVASRVVGLPRRPHVVFVDGHCQSALDEMWRALFSSLRFAKSFAGPVCFRHAILVPLGYQTAMFEGLDGRIDCSGVAPNETEQHQNTRKTTRLSEFGEMMRASVGLPPNEHRSSWTSGHTILFIRRENYVAHPRATGKVESRFSNEKQIFTSLKSWAASYSGCKLNVVNGLFAHMHMEDQIEIIQHSTIIVGAHGAGLSHIISALPNTSVLEILSPSYRRPHFALIARWKGLNYHPLYLNSSYAHPVTVIKALDDIVKGLGC